VSISEKLVVQKNKPLKPLIKREELVAYRGLRKTARRDDGERKKAGLEAGDTWRLRRQQAGSLRYAIRWRAESIADFQA